MFAIATSAIPSSVAWITKPWSVKLLEFGAALAMPPLRHAAAITTLNTGIRIKALQNGMFFRDRRVARAIAFIRAEPPCGVIP
jgi:hypothetical protein